MNTFKAVTYTITVIFLLIISLASTKNAFASVTLEQQINIIDQEFNSTDTEVPNDNSLGLIHWDGSKYNGETVYFEAVIRCDACSGGNNQVTAGLFSSAGALVTDSTVSTSSNTYTWDISSAITANLVDNTDYTVRITRDATAGTAYIKSARLKVIQSATNLTDSQTQIELGNISSTTNSSYELVSSPKLMNYNPYNYAPLPTAYFEATLKSADASGVSYAMLSSSANCSTAVGNSEVSNSGTSWALVRSASISLESGTTYFVCVKSSGVYVASIANAKLIFDQSSSIGIAKLETYHTMVNTHVTHADSTYTSQKFDNQFNPNNFQGARFNYFFETTINASGDTAYATLYNQSDSVAISNSEVTTTSSSYTRLRTMEITNSLPSSSKTLDTQIKNSATSNTHLSNSWLVIQMSTYPQLSFNLEGVAGSTLTNGITTSSASQPDSLDFATLTTGTPKYIAHKLTASANTASGYSVTMKLTNTLQGNYPANIIEAFPSTWADPQSWTEPTGTTANVNTGWIGANTSDTRISGWSSASGLFGPVGTTAQKVMESTGIDTGSSIYVTYAIEVNQYQPTDVYMGTLVYDVTPTY